MERLSALVLSHDDDALRTIQAVLGEHDIEADVVRNIIEGNERLQQQRFDLAVCDYDFPCANELACLEPASPWRGIMFALVGEEQLGKTKGQRIHVRLAKPLSQGLFGKGLRAVYSTLIQERRAASRRPVGVEVSHIELIVGNDHRDLAWARVINASHTGICLQTREVLPRRAMVQVTFELPEEAGLINLEGEVVWSKPPGRCGLRFNHVPALSRKKLVEWLDARHPAHVM